MRKCSICKISGHNKRTCGRQVKNNIYDIKHSLMKRFIEITNKIGKRDLEIILDYAEFRTFLRKEKSIYGR